ncbi:hypothetical protein O5629_27330, partial [Escherichia coli]|nr:hypothetical protein [Escherichia coli]
MSKLNNKVFTKPKHYNFWDVSVFADNMIYIHRQSKYADINESLLIQAISFLSLHASFPSYWFL